MIPYRFGDVAHARPQPWREEPRREEPWQEDAGSSRMIILMQTRAPARQNLTTTTDNVEAPWRTASLSRNSGSFRFDTPWHYMLPSSDKESVAKKKKALTLSLLLGLPDILSSLTQIRDPIITSPPLPFLLHLRCRVRGPRRSPS